MVIAQASTSDFSLLLGCGAVLWHLAMLAGMVMVEFRLSRMQRQLDAQIKWMEAQYKAANPRPSASMQEADGTSRAAPPPRPK